VERKEKKREGCSPSIALVEALGLAHGALDVERLDVLPVLLEQGDEEVDGEPDVLAELVLREADVADAETHAQHLLELELDGGAGVLDLGLEVVVTGDETGELAGLVKTGAEDPRDLLDEGLRGKEVVVLLGELLDELLVLVELLEHVNIHPLKVRGLGLVDVDLVTENADLHLASGVGEPVGTRETLVLLGVVVLKGDLELNGLLELSLLLLGARKDLLDALSEVITANLRHV
jgi:hypothetical protein